MSSAPVASLGRVGRRIFSTVDDNDAQRDSSKRTSTSGSILLHAFSQLPDKEIVKKVRAGEISQYKYDMFCRLVQTNEIISVTCTLHAGLNVKSRSQ